MATQVDIVLNAKVTGTGDLARLRNDIRSARDEAAKPSPGRGGAPAFQRPASASSSGASLAGGAIGALSAASSGNIGGFIASGAQGMAEKAAGSAFSGKLGAVGAVAGVAAAALAGAYANLSMQMDSANEAARNQLEQGRKEVDLRRSLLDLQIRFDAGLARAGISLRNLSAALEDVDREARRGSVIRDTGSSFAFNATEDAKLYATSARDIAVAKANAERESARQAVYDAMRSGAFSAPLAARKLAEIDQAHERTTYSAGRTASISVARSQVEQDDKALSATRDRASSESASAEARVAAIAKQVEAVERFYKSRTGVSLGSMRITELPEFQRRQNMDTAGAELRRTAMDLPQIREANWTEIFRQFRPGSSKDGFAASVEGLFSDAGPLKSISDENKSRVRAWAESNKALLKQIAESQENDKALADYISNRKALEDAVLRRDELATSGSNAVAAQQRKLSASRTALSIASASAINPAQAPLPFVAPPRPDTNLGGRARLGLFADGIQSNMRNFAGETAKNTGHMVAQLRQILGTLQLNSRHGT